MAHCQAIGQWRSCRLTWRSNSSIKFHINRTPAESPEPTAQLAYLYFLFGAKSQRIIHLIKTDHLCYKTISETSPANSSGAFNILSAWSFCNFLYPATDSIWLWKSLKKFDWTQRSCPQRHQPSRVGNEEELRAFSGPQQRIELSGFFYSKDRKSPNARLRNCWPSVEGFSIFWFIQFFRKSLSFGS